MKSTRDFGAAHYSTGLERSDRTRRLIAVGAGNFMEWFDFAIYGYFAAIIGATFFPSENETAEMLSSLAVFAVGFISRPFGALLLGPIGDRHGRRAVLIITVLGMGTVTALIGLTPSFETIGIAGPILIVCFRLVQGAFAGSEWTSAAVYIIESAPARRRALYGSMITGTAGLAFLVGTVTAAILTSVLSEGALNSWGWRIPFVSSFAMALIAIYVRRRLEDTPVYEEVERRRAENDVEAVPRADMVRSFIFTLAFSGIFGTSLYYLVTYMNNYLSGPVDMTRLDALVVCGVVMVIYVIFNPIVGIAADRIGRRPLLFTGIIGLILWSAPAFWLMSRGEMVIAGLALVPFAFFVACTAVINNALLVEVFPASVRATGSAIGYNVGYALLAGPGPLIAAWLAGSVGLVAPALYVTAVAIVALAVLAPRLPETKGIDITQG